MANSIGEFRIPPQGPFSLARAVAFGFGLTSGAPPDRRTVMRLAFCVDRYRTKAHGAAWHTSTVGGSRPRKSSPPWPRRGGRSATGRSSCSGKRAITPGSRNTSEVAEAPKCLPALGALARLRRSLGVWGNPAARLILVQLVLVRIQAPQRRGPIV